MSSKAYDSSEPLVRMSRRDLENGVHVISTRTVVSFERHDGSTLHVVHSQCRLGRRVLDRYHFVRQQSDGRTNTLARLSFGELERLADALDDELARQEGEGEL